MRILADTNIFIDFWKNPNEELLQAFEREDIVICGVVRSELLHGAVSKKNLNEISDALDCFRSVEMSEDDWDEFGRRLFLLRTQGVTVPFADAVIAYIAIKNRLTLWTNDKHFKLIQGVFPELQVR